MNERLRILVADDEHTSRRLIVGQLRREFEVLDVEDGAQAIAAYDGFQPDVVVLDVDMPGLNGVDTARAIKARNGSRFVPVFLVSGLDQEPTLIRGLTAGADDFLPKPFNGAVFKPKLEVFLRLREMQRRLLEQNAALEAFREETEAEQKVASEIFDRVRKRGALADPRVCAVLSPLSVLNGDTVAASETRSGHFRLLLADVSGHGLTGALGTLPVMTLFHASIEQGDSLVTAAMRLNAELKTMLPPRLFCAAVLLELDRANGELELINAGMPTAWISSPSGVRAFPSTHCPLGITKQWTPVAQRIEVQPGQRVIVLSDGLVEAQDAGGELFGEARLRDALLEGLSIPELLARVAQFAGVQRDDVAAVDVAV